MLEHRQSSIRVNDGIGFTVDTKLQGLIQYLWDSEIFTFNSCEDNVRNKSWIEFELDCWIELYEIVFRHGRELYEYIIEKCEVTLLAQDDGRLDQENKYWIEGDNLIWSASVRFPKEEINLFEDLVRDAIASWCVEDA